MICAGAGLCPGAGAGLGSPAKRLQQAVSNASHHATKGTSCLNFHNFSMFYYYLHFTNEETKAHSCLTQTLLPYNISFPSKALDG